METSPQTLRPKQQFTDQLGRTIEVPFPPQRIISVVPSQSELLHYLGLKQEVAGITKFCIHPESQFRSKPRIGGTKNIHLDRVRDLQPDLIIANKEENEREQIETLANEFPVWISDILTPGDALEMIRGVGQLCNRTSSANMLADTLQGHFESQRASILKPRKAAYFIWRQPYMIAARHTFINSMLSLAGFHNVFQHLGRYPEITLDQLAEAQPEVILLSSEPYPFATKHLAEFAAACPVAQILLVNGEYFSWYGNRLLYSCQYFQQLRLQLS